MYSAQLATIHEQINAAIPPAAAPAVGLAGADGDANRRIGADQIERALAETKPSVSQAERARYDRIYQSFGGSRGAGFSDMPLSADAGKKKATLA